MFSLWYFSFVVNKRHYLKDTDVFEKLETEFQELEKADNCFSLLKIHVNRGLFDRMKYKMTDKGSTLYNVIHSGCVHLDSTIGVYAPDPQSYDVFSSIFDPIIEDFHEGFGPQKKHPKSDYGDIDTIREIDPCGDYILATKVRCSRNIKGLSFLPTINECHLLEAEGMVKEICETFTDDLQGDFYYYNELTDEQQEMLKEAHAFFTNNDRFLEAGNIYNMWPLGRGIFLSDEKTLIVFTNYEDHILIISSQEGGDLKSVYHRFLTALNKFERRLTFEHHDRLGYLTTCPSNLGTALRASVKVRLPNLSQNEDHLEDLCEEHNLLVHTCGNGIYDISNKQRLGCTEYQCIKWLQDGISEIIQLEKVSKAYYGECAEREQSMPCDFADQLVERHLGPMHKPCVMGAGAGTEARGTTRGSTERQETMVIPSSGEDAASKITRHAGVRKPPEPFSLPCAPGTGLITPPDSQYASEAEDTDMETSGQSTPGETETDDEN